MTDFGPEKGSAESGSEEISVPLNGPPEDNVIHGTVVERAQNPGPLFWFTLTAGWAVIVFGIHGLISNWSGSNPPAVLRTVIGLNVVNDALVVPVVLGLAATCRRLPPVLAARAATDRDDHDGGGRSLRLSSCRKLGKVVSGGDKPAPVGLRPQSRCGDRSHLGVLCASRSVALENSPRPPSLSVSPVPTQRGIRLIRVGVFVTALVPIVIYLHVALCQLGYPFELEWMEGGAVEMVGRVLHGQALYVAPSLHYVPYTYPPLYFWMSALVAKMTGLSFLPLRLVSLVSSVGCFGLLFWMVKRETRAASRRVRWRLAYSPPPTRWAGPGSTLVVSTLCTCCSSLSRWPWRGELMDSAAGCWSAWPCRLPS